MNAAMILPSPLSANRKKWKGRLFRLKKGGTKKRKEYWIPRSFPGNDFLWESKTSIQFQVYDIPLDSNPKSTFHAKQTQNLLTSNASCKLLHGCDAAMDLPIHPRPKTRNINKKNHEVIVPNIQDRKEQRDTTLFSKTS